MPERGWWPSWGQRLQIGRELSNHDAYLRSWTSVLRESAKVLLPVVSKARQAVDLICPEPPALRAGAHGRGRSGQPLQLRARAPLAVGVFS